MPEYINVSHQTHDSVMGKRRLKRRGIVIHTTEGINSLAWLQGASASSGNPVSSDFLINRKGDIFQITPAGYYAYHSGRARWALYQEQDGSINQGFYGVELENSSANGQRVTNLQYISLAFLTRVLVTASFMDLRNIVGHYQVALPSGRKSDPTGFDWGVFAVECIHPSKEWRDYLLLEEIP